MQPDLFDVFEPSRPTPVALKAYLADWGASSAHATLRARSVEVYADMWRVFSGFCMARRAWPEELTAADLRAHLEDRTLGRHGNAAEHRSGKGAGRELTARYAWRLLRLIDLVLVSRRGEEDRPGPPTAAAQLLESIEEYRYANADEGPLPEYLPAGDARRLVAYLSSARARPGRVFRHVTWKVMRKRAAVALQLSAGLGPGEVRALKVADLVCTGGRRVAVPWKVLVPETSTAPEREAPIAAWAGELLKAWLEIRSQQALPGEVLFPGTRAGRVWGKESQYICFKEVMADAEIPISRGDSFQLRHTYALC